jgi:hypothetical protein
MSILHFPVERRGKSPNALLAKYHPGVREVEDDIRENAKELKHARRKWDIAVRRYERTRAAQSEPRKRVRRLDGKDIRQIECDLAREELSHASRHLKFCREILDRWLKNYIRYGHLSVEADALRGGLPRMKNS